MENVNNNISPENDEEDIKIKLEKALAYNRQMQLQLLVARKKLETLLNNVKDNYKANDELLKDGLTRQRKKGVGILGAYTKGGTFYLKGNMFFKDIKCRNCPNNPDYIRRKYEDNEMFPMDLELKSRHVWSTRDKQGVVAGIKEQIIDYLTNTSRKAKKKEKSEVDSEKLAKLLSMVPKSFKIDWDHISGYNVLHRHSPSTCEAIWNVFLNPTLKRSAWTEAENQKLLEASQKYRFQNWEAIAQEVGNRSDFQCFVQYKNQVIYMLPEHRRAKWSKEDDQRLLDVVAKNTVHGIVTWSNVMAEFPHKPKTTLQSRYFYSLDPNASRAPFTPEEDLLLFATVKEYGTKFKCFPRHLFPNRTVVQLRAHYNNTLRNRHQRTPWNLEEDMKLMEFVTKHGAKSWQECSKFLENKHSRISCRTRFITIKKYLEKNPDASIDDLPRKHLLTGTITTENWNEKLKELNENPNANFSRTKRKRVKKKKNPTKPEESDKPAKEPKPTKTPNAEKKSRNKNVRDTDYISTLKTNGIQYYNFFKYAYNFKMDQDPGNQILPNNQILTIVRSSLNPQIQLPVEGYSFDDTIPVHVRTNIKNALQATNNYQVPQLLPPNFSSAVAFRALCVHAAYNNPTEQVTLSEQNDSNNHILLFRQRLRTLLYSTALLSRLNPNMVGRSTTLAIEDITTPTPAKKIETTTTTAAYVTTTETKPERLDHPLNVQALLKRVHEDENESDNTYKNASKKICTDSIVNIKTEIEP